ncbi:acyltransferase family protein [Shewanella holmiensis]|uniref:Acyltransferase n=1 Tax=Shewanella holmiensis TaxID=2952222 RepID=A0A9X2WPI0_9GAMM|nr:acyltransferase [Shewanella holmiensis]MCT7942959.1 acyltransferase [Shewanella holmiensis]
MSSKQQNGSIGAPVNFRNDINGLRAIAVLAVVIFHFKPDLVPGGFAGVDVFFVISGYLMTRIIFKGLENDTFNLIKFYIDRANRIIPALAFLCLIVLVFGWYNLSPIDYKSLGKHVTSSVSFVSNMIYWRESGYFDSESHSKWLLHTWSLSVEWQFYIIYPLILITIKRLFSINTCKTIITLVTLVGFVTSVFITLKWPDSAYYLLPTRAWEMLAGALTCIYPLSTSPFKKCH